MDVLTPKRKHECRFHWYANYSNRWCVQRVSSNESKVHILNEVGGRNSLLAVFWALCPAWCSIMGLIFLWGEVFQWRGFFSLELTWVLTPFPQNSFRWEYKLRSSLCIHAFHLKDLKRSWHSCPRQMNASNKNTQHAPSTKTECDYLYGWIKKRSHKQKSHPKWWTPEM